MMKHSTLRGLSASVMAIFSLSGAISAPALAQTAPPDSPMSISAEFPTPKSRIPTLR